MNLNADLAISLKYQAAAEYQNAFAYRNLASYFDSVSLDGFRDFMIRQYRDEIEHAEKFIEYLSDRMADATVEDVLRREGKLPTSPVEAFQIALQAEQETTQRIYDLCTLATSAGDFQTQQFLHWFLSEQIEEEKTISDWLQRLTIATGESAALFELDERAKS